MQTDLPFGQNSPKNTNALSTLPRSDLSVPSVSDTFIDIDQYA